MKDKLILSFFALLHVVMLSVLITILMGGCSSIQPTAEQKTQLLGIVEQLHDQGRIADKNYDVLKKVLEK